MIALLLFVGLIAPFIIVNWTSHSSIDWLFRRGQDTVQRRAERRQQDERDRASHNW